MEVWEQEIQQVDDSDSVEGILTHRILESWSFSYFPPSVLPSTDEYGRKKVQVTLLPEDVRKLKCETRDEKTQSKWFGLDYVIRRWRRIDLEKLPEHVSTVVIVLLGTYVNIMTIHHQYIGQRQRTKDDVYLWQFRSDIKVCVSPKVFPHSF